ncbi:MAG: C1 family peptidase [Candidatus Marinimicrobia bacterium]|nr:C1 family peptidase [Candidatus Neomarinimicrobiota bacterium]
MNIRIKQSIRLLLVTPFILTLCQAQSGSISNEMLEKIRSSVQMDSYTKAMQNAVSNNDIRQLALNRSILTEIDHHFAYKIPISPITDQKSSGRCWLFTALNVIRPKVIEKYNLKEFEFSQNYLFFWDQLEKSNLFLEAVIRTRDKDIDDREVQWLFRRPVGDGGVWNMMPSLVEKYGLVPKDVMPESYNSENTLMMRRLVRRKIRSQGMQIREWHAHGKSEKYIRKKKLEMLSDIYRILIISLGTPTTEFTWRYTDVNDSLIVGKTYTPLEFYNEVVETPLCDYVMLMDDPSREYFKLYEIEYDRNRWDSRNWTFINLPAKKIKKFAKQSILADEPMYFSCDVGKHLDRDKGLLAVDLYDYESVYGVSFNMTKKERILSYESGSTHGMSLVGIDTTGDGTVTKWLLENSWGPDAGNDGYLTMTDDWFDKYMFRLVILKHFLPQDILDVLKQKPVILPPWDRMF